jgi:RNA polymerase sigma-70 factor (ECF subfamily)
MKPQAGPGIVNRMEPTRSSLLQNLRDFGDAQAWGEFLLQYEGFLLRFVRRLGIRSDDAPDVVQDVMLKLVKSLPRFTYDRSKGRFRDYLRQVTRSAIADWVNRNSKRREVGVAAEILANLEGRPDTETHWDECFENSALEVVHARVRGTSNPIPWDCYVRHIVKGQSADEVSKVLDLTTNQVYVYSSRLKAKVRRELDSYKREFGDE